MEIETSEPHGVELPVIMDATIPQTDGYRFIYVLPFGPRTLLIEDTHYSDAAGFDSAAYEAEVLAYAAARGWTVTAILRRERGALPITLDGDIDGLCADMSQVARVASRPASSIRRRAIPCPTPRGSPTGLRPRRGSTPRRCPASSRTMHARSGGAGASTDC